jgi:hypothetical protein
VSSRAAVLTVSSSLALFRSPWYVLGILIALPVGKILKNTFEYIERHRALTEHYLKFRFAPEQVLLLGEGELHQRLLGRPSTRSAMMLRRISEVPASIVFPRERSCWCCQ